MATNRADTLDPALLSPGRLDRKIEFPFPDRRQKRLVFTACTSKMNLSEEVDLEDYVNRPDKISAADISSICQEAGMMAVRRNRYVLCEYLYVCYIPNVYTHAICFILLRYVLQCYSLILYYTIYLTILYLTLRFYIHFTIHYTLSYHRYIILPKDFDEAYSKKVKKTDKEFTFYTT